MRFCIMASEAGLYVCERIIFLNLKFWEFFVRFMGDKNAEIFVQNEYTQCFLLDIVNIVIAI